MQAQEVDVPMVGQGVRGSSDLAPAHQLEAQSHPLADTLVKVHLRKEVGEYREALIQSQTMVHQEIHYAKVDACNKAKALLKDQRHSFEENASEFDQQAKDVCQQEVAETRANIHTEANSAINDASNNLKKNEINSKNFGQISPRPKSQVQCEASYKNHVIKKPKTLSKGSAWKMLKRPNAHCSCKGPRLNSKLNSLKARSDLQNKT